MQIYSNYIVTKRYRGFGLTNQAMNLPYGEPCRVVVDQGEGYIICHNRRVCCVNSQTALDFFTRNDDGNGIKRRKIIDAIFNVLNTLPKNEIDGKIFSKKWDIVWSDPICQKCRRQDIEGHWLWGYDFYNSSIDDLLHIANLIGAKI